MNTEAKLTKYVRASGCAAKLNPGSLGEATCRLESFHKDLIVAFEGNEDAGVYKVTDDVAMVQTIDFITPVVDDPFVYGQIAAANSLSDVFAMGAEAKTALNVVGFDGKHHDSEILAEILRGGADKAAECGAVIVGGHTIETPEMLYGLSATGFIHPEKVLRNNGIREGDHILLTKPLGMGILITAIKADLLPKEVVLRVAENLKTLNLKASRIAVACNAHGCTDVTGFGFLGHLGEMSAGNFTIKVHADQVPYFPEATEMAAMGIIPAGSYANRDFLKANDRVAFRKALTPEMEMILFDAQTSGGLLISGTPEDVAEMEKRCKEEGLAAAVIGEVVKKEEADLVVC